MIENNVLFVEVPLDHPLQKEKKIVHGAGMEFDGSEAFYLFLTFSKQQNCHICGGRKF